MNSPTEDQIRSFRLRSHHLDRIYGRETLLEAAGACGLQNSPPGAWEAAIHNRIPELGGKELRDVLEENKILLQAWSFRGVPVVFPAEERRTVANPGAVVTEGRVTGIWTARKKKDGLEVDISLWEPGDSRRRLTELAEDYAAFRELALSELTWTEGGDREWN